LNNERIELNFVLENPTIIKEDNRSTIAIALNPISHQRVKHLQVKSHFLRDHISKKDVELMWCDTQNMIADALTKALPAVQHQRLILRQVNLLL
jgi:hypothetical protein